jgi:nucleoside-diphosphate-sugar epimerase
LKPCNCYILGSGYLATLFRDGCLLHDINPVLVTDRLIQGGICGWEVTGTAEFLRRLGVGLSPLDLVVNATGPGSAAIGEDEADRWFGRQSVLLAEMVQSHLPPRMVVVSSGGTVYGDHGALPISEDSELRGITPYARYQIAMEESYRKVFGHHLTLLRVANPYGLHQFGKSGQGFVSTLIRNLLSNQVTTVFGGGGLVRDYFYEDDLYSLVPALFSTASAGVFNIGSGVGLSQNSVIEAVAKVFGRTPDLSFVDGRTADIPCNILSAEVAKEGLGWQATGGLEEGLTRMRKKLQELL